MSEKPKYVSIPDFDRQITMDAIHSGDLNDRTYGLYSLTYYSGDYNLILKTLEKYIRDELWETRYTVYQCLERFLRLFGEIPIDPFLSYILDGLNDEDEQVQGNAQKCLYNLFYCITPDWTFKIKEVHEILKNGSISDCVKVLIFVNHHWKGEKLAAVIRKCIKHPDPIIQNCAGFVLKLFYDTIRKEILHFESVTKLATRSQNKELKSFSQEYLISVEWIEEDMNTLKKQLEQITKRNS